MTDGGVDFSLECVGNVELMGQALRAAHKGWGQSIVIGVAGAGEEIHARPFLLVTGRSWRGTAFGGVRGRTELPRYVGWYLSGRIKVDELVTHTMRLEDINRAFDLMHAGESIRSVVRLAGDA
jgi:S-(hydroxymethyl)glutathione dehydrogenase/alcohol dehydrogenase